MRYPSAYAGVKKIFGGTVLKLIGSLFLAAALFTGLLALARLDAAAEPISEEALILGIGTTAAIIPGTILPIIAFFLAMVGLSEASRDEEANFQIAFWISIAGVVITVVDAAFKGTGVDTFGFVDMLSDVAALVATIFMINGVTVLAKELGRDDVIRFGRVVKAIAIAILATAVALTVLKGNAAVSMTSAKVSIVLGVVSTSSFLAFLARAKAMLAE